MRILLINPPAINFYHRVGLRMCPLGLGYVAAVLKGAGYGVKVIDLNVERINYRTYPYQKYDLVGISVDTTRYPISLEIAEAAKKKGIKVVMGGPHVTFFDLETLLTQNVDYVVRGEGEYIMLELVKHLNNGKSLDEIKGITYRSGDQIIRNPAAPLVQNLDNIPFPARELLPMDRYTNILYGRYSSSMMTSRGCPFNCEFCSCSAFSGMKWRTRSLDNILKEIDLLYNKYGYRAISFLDDNFTLNPKRVIELCETIIKKSWDLFWYAFSRVDTIVKNERMIQLMKKAGLSQVFVGFESGSQEVLDKMGKNVSVEKAYTAMEILKKHGVRVWGSFIIGALNETRQMIKETIKFAKKLNPQLSQFSILTPYPGTRLYEKVKDQLLTSNWESFWGGEPVMKLNKITTQEMKDLIVRAYASYYLRPSKFITIGLPRLYELFLGYRRHKKNTLIRVNGDWAPRGAHI
ncbi:MAG: radical SAM protein [Candidatus Zixiibacteriota bacterium]